MTVPAPTSAPAARSPTVVLARSVHDSAPASVSTNLLRTIPSRFGGISTVVVFSALAIGATTPGFPRETPFVTAILGVILATSLAGGLASRRPHFLRGRLLDSGVLYQGIVAVGLACLDASTRAELVVPSLASLFLNVLLVAMPLALPSSTSRLLAVGVFASLVHPLALFLSIAPSARLAALPEIAIAAFPTLVFAALGVIAGGSIFRTRAALAQARELGRYELVELLGRGGMGEVWRARHRMLARPAAIKFVRPETLGASAESLAEALPRFEREARITAGLTSPHTIEIYDFGVTEEGALCYVMEHLDGLDLESLVRESGPMPAARAVYLLRQACISLAEAHQAGLVHRDVKPANIYICRKGLQYDFVKVLDFGLVAQAASASTGPGERGAVMGTPAYLAPEVALGKPADARADLYSLGCVAYWMLTGRPVFEGKDLLETITHQVRTKPDPPSVHAKQPIPRDLELLVLTLLQKDPAARVHSAHDLSKRLALCDVRPIWTPGQAMKWWTAREAAFAGGAATASKSAAAGTPAGGTARERESAEKALHLVS